MGNVWQTQLCAEVTSVEQLWLTYSESLTTALEQALNAPITVQVTYNDWGRCVLDEPSFFHINTRTYFIREVQLFIKKQLLIIARSVIAPFTLQATQNQLQGLGNRSLGHFLFSYPGMQRDPLTFMSNARELQHYTCLQSHHEHFKRILARRSLFKLDNYPLLLTEFFMPEFRSLVNAS